MKPLKTPGFILKENIKLSQRNKMWGCTMYSSGSGQGAVVDLCEEGVSKAAE